MNRLLGFYCLLASFAFSNVLSDTILLTGVMRDFWPATAHNNPACQRRASCGTQGLPAGSSFSCENINCHPDFQVLNCGLKRGFIAEDLDEDKKPRLKPANQFPSSTCWASQERFAQWYRNTQDVNIAFQIDLPLTNSVANPTLYTYSNAFYFPINGRGYGNWENDRNFHFTTEIKARFTYRGGERFTFQGDDDLWVFINDKLVVDIGGVHAVETGMVDIDTLGLTLGANYPFVIFHAERHTSASNFNAITSLDLYCPWSDHCGVCQGDGQSCCTCNDGNVCTRDRCDIMTGVCLYTPNACPSDGDLCTREYCDPTVAGNFNPVTHCKTEATPCGDDNACTLDLCTALTGCRNTPINCNDQNACTADSCNPLSGCANAPITCDDANPCTQNLCEPASGCGFPPIQCADAIAQGLTCPSCLDGDCTTDAECNDQNACTVDTCDPTGACRFTVDPCPQPDPCQPRVCNPATGCVITQFVDTCADGNACTTETCVVNGGIAECAWAPLVCDDGNLCTIDSCNTTAGCVFTPQDCDDNNACTADSCNPTTGECTHTPVQIPVTHKCQNHYCDEVVGIITNDVICRPTDKCTCDPAEGCKCPGLFGDLPAEGVGIGAGIIALIIIGIVVGIACIAAGGTGGAYMYRRVDFKDLNGIKNNPLYEDTGAQGNNPLYE